MKEWYSARELAEFNLPTIPHTLRGVQISAAKNKWPARERQAQGGGYEYHVSALPLPAQAMLVERFIVRKDLAVRAVIEQPKDGQQRRLDARLIILHQYEIHNAGVDLAKGRAQLTFCMLYRGRMIEQMPGWVYDAIPEMTDRTLRRWKKARAEEQFAKLAQGKNNRIATGHLDRAENGKVAQFIGGHILAKPQLHAGHLRDLCRREFGDTVTVSHAKTGRAYSIPMPSLRIFQMFVRNWKERNADIILKLTNPDSFKNKRQMALGKADASIERLNQQWQIDASPADVLCIDGRYCVYALIDVWSRRAMFTVSRTASTEGALLLVRKAILAWGVPEQIKTDNGSDFISHRFKRALLHLGIEQPVATPFTPEQKGFVERVIGTMQGQLMPILPGFIGHNVADRKAIEARKAFAQRLGVDDKNALSVQLKSDELQLALDRWSNDKYAATPRRSLDGMSPQIKASSWAKPVARIENERALDLLLAESHGLRTIGKKGLRIDNADFYGPGIEVMVGKQVFVRCDPQDMGRVFAFQPDTDEFICEALCLNRMGVERATAAEEAKARQKKFMAEETREAQRQKRQITPGRVAEMYLSQAAADASKIVTLPGPSTPYSTPSLDEAGKAFVTTSTTQDSPEDAARRAQLAQTLRFPTPKHPTKDQDDHERWWQKAQRLFAIQSSGRALPVMDSTWLAMIEGEAWYKARLKTEGLIQQRSGANPPT